MTKLVNKRINVLGKSIPFGILVILVGAMAITGGAITGFLLQDTTATATVEEPFEVSYLVNDVGATACSTDPGTYTALTASAIPIGSVRPGQNVSICFLAVNSNGEALESGWQVGEGSTWTDQVLNAVNTTGGSADFVVQAGEAILVQWAGYAPIAEGDATFDVQVYRAD